MASAATTTRDDATKNEQNVMTMLKELQRRNQLHPGEYQLLLGTLHRIIPFSDKVLAYLYSMDMLDKVMNMNDQLSTGSDYMILKEVLSIVHEQGVAINQKCHPLLDLDTPAHEEFVALMKQLCEAVKCNWNYYPRYTQLVSVIMIFFGQGYRGDKTRGGRLIQMFTGEGKTIVVAMTAAMFAKIGRVVDVVTSSASLAERDAGITRKFFDSLDITVDYCKDDEISIEQIVKLEEFLEGHSKYHFPSRLIERWSTAIKKGSLPQDLQAPENKCLYEGDEDSIIKFWKKYFPDYNGQYPTPDIESLRYTTSYPEKCYTADVVYGTTNQIQGDLLRHLLKKFETRTGKDGKMRPLDIVICDECDSMMCDSALHSTQLSSEAYGMYYLNLQLVTLWCQFIIGDMRGIKDENAPGKVTFLNEKELEQHAIKFVDKALKNPDDKDFQITIPNYLREFAVEENHKFAENARYAALHYHEKKDYDVTNSDIDGNFLDIIPINMSTGEKQKRMRWDNGLHEFLQMKHKLPIESMRLCDNNLSNKQLFRGYQYVFGITGTLGGETDHEFLRDTYDVDFRFIPPFTPSKRIDGPNFLYQDQVSWLNHLAEEVAMHVHNERAVLIICDTILMVQYIQEQLQSMKILGCNICTYTDKDKDNISFHMKSGDVLISTNLAGRGTDLEMDSEVLKANGLHVIMSYMPSNERIQLQGFGRAGRAGQPGSAQIIACADHPQVGGVDYVEHDVTDLAKRYFESTERRRNQLESERVKQLVIKSKGPDAIEECFIELLKVIEPKTSTYRLNKKDEEEKVKNSNQQTIEIFKRNVLNGLRKIDASLCIFDTFVIQSVLEKFAFWKKKNEKRFQTEHEALKIEFRKDVLPKLEDLLKNLTDEVQNSDLFGKGLNPFRLIEKGYWHATVYDYELARNLFTASIKDNPEFSAFAYYNRALARIELGEFDEANKDLCEAATKIEQIELARICSMAVMLENLPKVGDKDDQLSKQFELYTTLLSSILSNIDEAKKTLQDLRDNGHTPGAYYASKTDATNFHLKRNSTRSINRQLFSIGFFNYIKVYCKKKKKSSIWDAVLCGIIGIVQIVGGALLTYFTGGLLAQVGYALIMEGMSDLIYAIEHGIKGDFSWGNWAVKKAVSLAVTALTLGFGGFTGTAVGTSVFKYVGNAVARELIDRGLNFLVDKALQEVIKMIIEKFSNQIKGAIDDPIENLVNRCDNIKESMMFLRVLEVYEKRKDDYTLLYSHFEQAGKILALQPTMSSTISGVSSSISGALKNVKTENSTISAITKIVGTVCDIVDVSSKVTDIVQRLTGIGVLGSFSKVFELHESQKEIIHEILSIPSTFENYLRGKNVCSDQIIIHLKEVKAIDASGIPSNDFESLVKQLNYEEEAANELIKRWRTYIESKELKEKILDTARSQHILHQLMDSWKKSFVEFVIDNITKGLQKLAASELRKLGESYASQFLESSQNVKNMFIKHAAQQKLLTDLVTKNKSLIDVAVHFTSTFDDDPRVKNIAGSINDVNTFKKSSESFIRGDIHQGLKLLAQTEVGKSAIKALNEGIQGLGDMPFQKLRTIGVGSLNLIAQDIVREAQGLDLVGKEYDQVIDFVNKLKNHDIEGALDHISVFTTDQRLVSSLNIAKGYKDQIVEMAQFCKSLEAGKYQEALETVSKTKFAVLITQEWRDNQSEINSLVADGKALVDLPKVVQNMNKIIQVTRATKEGRLDAAIELVESMTNTNMNETRKLIVNTLDIAKHVQHGSLDKIFICTMNILGDDKRGEIENMLIKLINPKLSPYFSKKIWPDYVSKVRDTDFQELRGIFTECFKNPDFSNDQCKQIFTAVETVNGFVDDFSSIDTKLQKLHKDMIAAVVWIAVPKLLASQDAQAFEKIDHLLNYLAKEANIILPSNANVFIREVAGCYLAATKFEQGKIVEANRNLSQILDNKQIIENLDSFNAISQSGAEYVKRHFDKSLQSLPKDIKHTVEEFVSEAKLLDALIAEIKIFIDASEDSVDLSWRNLMAALLKYRRIVKLDEKSVTDVENLGKRQLKHVQKIFKDAIKIKDIDILKRFVQDMYMNEKQANVLFMILWLMLQNEMETSTTINNVLSRDDISLKGVKLINVKHINKRNQFDNGYKANVSASSNGYDSDGDDLTEAIKMSLNDREDIDEELEDAIKLSLEEGQAFIDSDEEIAFKLQIELLDDYSQSSDLRISL